MASKLFIIACEASGDHHGAELILHLRTLRPDLEVRGLGGPQMAKAGVSLLHDMTAMSALGLGDVLKKYFSYKKIFDQALAEVQSWNPDLVCVIDSPAFNLRFAKALRKLPGRIPLAYYISPQLWAWGGRRIHTVKRTVDHMLVILPFEKELYDKHGIPCTFVGHPLLDKIHDAGPDSKDDMRRKLNLGGGLLIGLLPGSRTAEVERIFPVMVQAAQRIQKRFPAAKFLVGRAPGKARELYDRALAPSGLQVSFFDSDFYAHVTALDFALVTSGTATLETALCGTPFFLLYKTGWSTYWMGRALVRVKFLGLANLLLGRGVIPEFIQHEACAEKIAVRAITFLENPEKLTGMQNEFRQVRKILGSAGASKRAAQALHSLLPAGAR